MNLINKETEILEDQFEEYALQLNAKDFACRAKAKAKPQQTEFAGSSPRIVIERRNWIDIVPGKYSLSEYEVSKKVIHIFVIHSKYIEKKTERFISGEYNTGISFLLLLLLPNKLSNDRQTNQ